MYFKNLSLKHRRFLSMNLDAVFTYAIIFIILVVVLMLSLALKDLITFNMGHVTVILMVVLFYLINFLSFKKYGTTLGYKYLNLKIVSRDGGELSSAQILWRTTVRGFAYSLAPSFFVYLLFFFYNYSPDNEGEKSIVDLLSSTKVIDYD